MLAMAAAEAILATWQLGHCWQFENGKGAIHCSIMALYIGRAMPHRL